MKSEKKLAIAIVIAAVSLVTPDVLAEQLLQSDKRLAGLNNSLKADPLNQFAYFARAQYFQSVHQSARSFDDLTDCLILAERDHHDQNVYLHLREQANYLALAEKKVAEIQHDRKNVHSLESLARIQHASRKIEEAVASYTEALRIGPPTAELYELRGEAYSDLLETKQALRDFDSALALNKNFARAYAMRSSAYLEMQKPLKALVDAKALMDLQGRSAAYRLSGLAYTQMKNYQGAFEAFGKGLAIDSGDRQARQARIDLCVRQKMYQKAIDDLSFFVARGTSTDEQLSQSARCHIHLAQYNQALLDLNNLVAHSKNGHLERGYVYLKLGQYKAALDDLNAAITRSPFNSQAFLWRSQCYEKLGEHALALKDQSKADAIKRKLLEDL